MVNCWQFYVSLRLDTESAWEKHHLYVCGELVFEFNCFLHGRASTSMNAIQGMMKTREISRHQTKDFSTVYRENSQCAIDMSYPTDSINHHTPNNENTT